MIDRPIDARQRALELALEHWRGQFPVSNDQILETARAFEAYLLGEPSSTQEVGNTRENILSSAQAN